jgi:serine/threonine-protein kinase
MTTPLGKYKLVKLIASGGMAEVYLARQAGAAGFEKRVCLKRILPHLARDKQFVDMFLNEARLAASLDHPNIVSIFDLGEANGNYFIAMEFIDGPSLRAVHKRAADLNELLPIPELLKIISMAAGGLEYAHNLCDADGNALGLVHRDISPDNILVHRNGSAKVVDFGIAKAANSSGHTRTGTLKGKVAYMSPEQLRGEPLDRRTDVFALGVVLYEMVSGRRPWDAVSDVALIGKIVAEDAPPLGELRPDAPRELLNIVDRALAKDRGQRHQSCAELQADLEALLVGMSQTITQPRIADFVRAYSPEAQSNGGIDSTDQSIQAVEDEMNGTGAAPPLVSDGARAGSRDPGTLMLDRPIQGKSRALVYGLGAFLAIAVIGGVGGYLFVLKGDAAGEPVQVERASVVEFKPAPPAPEPVKVVEAPPPEPVKVVEAPPPEPVKVVEEQPKPRPQRVAAPPRAPVVVMKEPPKPAPAPVPTVTAMGELVLLIRPWAKVEVDGREVGVTPLDEPLMLSAGDHQVRLVNPDLGKDVSRTVHITPSEKEVLKEILDE